MDELVIKVQTPLQRRIVEQALALAQELEQVADNAPDGHVLDCCEQVALGSGREFLRQALTAALEQQAQTVEKRGAPGRRCSCGAVRRHKGRSSRRVVTALGRLTVTRAYFTCPACELGAYALDRRLGIVGLLSRQARRLVCWTGGRMAFAQAAETLEQLGGWTVSDETIRQTCQAEAAAIAAWRPVAEAAVADFRAAEGLPEFQTDAAKVNTDTGWRDVKIGIFAKRPAGEPACAAEWESRALPRPTARVALAAIEPSEQFGTRWRPWAERLGLSDPAQLNVLADGAEWIWDQVALQFPGAAELIDIYHASEHLCDAGKALFGTGTPEAAAWLEAGRQQLLSDGWYGLCEQIGQALQDRPDEACQAAIDALTTYFSKHSHRLNYAHRLHTGRSIGSGMVEGAAKNLIGKRLKQTGARWRVGNVPKIGELCCLTYSDGWSHYWDQAA